MRTRSQTKNRLDLPVSHHRSASSVKEGCKDLYDTVVESHSHNLDTGESRNIIILVQVCARNINRPHACTC